ncbi:MAG TPA: type IX secretion system membrane protein PorP/SprF [Bacteroidales bacterium]|nr:type IX secretion system membrane protein PorP/SprF [Bacteroidales bacterium]
MINTLKSPKGEDIILFIKFVPAFLFFIMPRLNLVILFLWLLLTISVNGQEIDPGAGYQAVMMNNPSMSGIGGDGTLRLSYLNFFPGNGYNLHSLYLSYDSFIQALHGGAAFYLVEDYLGGAVNNIRGGLSYSYFLQAGEDLFINAGLTFSVYHQGYNFSNSVLPDQIDPLGGIGYPSAEALKSSGRTVFDIGTGFTFVKGWLSGGISVMHLAEPDLTLQGMAKETIKRKFFAHVNGDLSLGKSNKFFARPLMYGSYQEKFIVASGGLSIETEHIAVNAIGTGDSSGNLNMQTGFSFKAGIIMFSYAYRFNIISGNSLIPMSLLHQTGLAISLYNVDKRNSIKTINFPKL